MTVMQPLSRKRHAYAISKLNDIHNITHYVVSYHSDDIILHFFPILLLKCTTHIHQQTLSIFHGDALPGLYSSHL